MAAYATNAEFRTLSEYHPDLVSEPPAWSEPIRSGSR